MMVAPLRYKAMIGQTSNVPCDNNTIWVDLNASINVYHSCNPSVTIKGLQPTQTGAYNPACPQIFPVLSVTLSRCQGL